MLKSNIFYIDPKLLIPYDNNVKIHTKSQIQKIKESIELFGFADPVGIDENKNIIEGHGRVVAAIELGLSQIPVFIISDLSDEQKKAYMLVHNQLTNNSGFDQGLLQEELSDITDIDMDRFSFYLPSEPYFDTTIEYSPPAKNCIIVVVGKDGAENIREFLEKNLIDYKEKYVR